MKNARETPIKYFLYARKSTESEDRGKSPQSNRKSVELHRIALRREPENCRGSAGIAIG